MDLPDRITIPILSPEQSRALCAEYPSDLTSVGAGKPLGNYPLDTLRYFGIPPNQLVDTLNSKPGVTAYIVSDSPTHSAGITAFHREALQALLNSDDNPDILRRAGWPSEATAFVERINAEWADYQTQPALCGVIADAFSGKTNTIATLLTEEAKERETGEFSISQDKVRCYVTQSAAGLADHIFDELNLGEARWLASRMTMRDLIGCIAQNQAVKWYRGNGQCGEFSLTPGDETQGKDDIYPLLTLTLDFEPACASALLAEANKRICGQHTSADARIGTPRTDRSNVGEAVSAGGSWSTKYNPGNRKGAPDIGR